MRDALEDAWWRIRTASRTVLVVCALAVLGLLSVVGLSAGAATGTLPPALERSLPIPDLPIPDLPIPGLAPPSGPTASAPLPAPELDPVLEWAQPGSVNRSALPLPRTGPVPSGLSLSSAGVDAVAVPVGLNSDGSAQVPQDPSRVGWYKPLGAPDGVGSDVLVGHVSYRGVKGVFHDLAEVSAGDPVTIRLTGGEVRRYRVESVQTYPKTQTPLKELYDPNGPDRLVLLTCGGEFDPSIRHFDSNVVVIALPA